MNLGILFLFKYFNFFNDSLRHVFNSVNMFYNVPAFQALLPVGISFYTFQTLSYTIDVYQKKRGAEKHLGIFAVYVAFFPQLVAGPIERSTQLLPQFRQKQSLSFERCMYGTTIILWGLFKKIIIADRLALFVNDVFAVPEAFSGISYIAATFFFAIQIYCDFSGYSDIAIGSAHILGFSLMKNFSRPYFARSIGEFWQRWHISLSTWFRDYLYIPLGGSRVSRVRWAGNLLVVFMVSGLWHGANWTFIIWGTLHGLFVFCSHLITPFVSQVRKASKHFHCRLIVASTERLVTFLIVLLLWIFFRANTLTDALYIYTHLGTGLTAWWQALLQGNVDGWLSPIVLQAHYMYDFSIALSMCIVLFIIHAIAEYKKTITEIFTNNTFLQLGACIVLLFVLIVFAPQHHEEFIYFQF